MSSTATGDKVSWLEERNGEERLMQGVALFPSGTHVMVRLGATSRLVDASRLTVRGKGCPLRGKGIDALTDAMRHLPIGLPVRSVVDCLHWQVTGGNCKLSNLALAILRDGRAAQVWKLIAGTLASVGTESEWGNVRRAADDFAAKMATPRP
jgi:hypothetical protein